MNTLQISPSVDSSVAEAGTDSAVVWSRATKLSYCFVRLDTKAIDSSM